MPLTIYTARMDKPDLTYPSLVVLQKARNRFTWELRDRDGDAVAKGSAASVAEARLNGNRIAVLHPIPSAPYDAQELLLAPFHPH